MEGMEEEDKSVMNMRLTEFEEGILSSYCILSKINTLRIWSRLIQKVFCMPVITFPSAMKAFLSASGFHIIFL